jgi:hypothetical protein
LTTCILLQPLSKTNHKSIWFCRHKTYLMPIFLTNIQYFFFLSKLI